MDDTQPSGQLIAPPAVPPSRTAVTERPAAGTTAADVAPPSPDARPPLRDRTIGWWPVLAVAVTAVVLGALLGFGLGRATGDSTGGPGGFGGPGRGGFPGQPGQQLGGQTGGQPGPPQLPSAG